ncbi:FAD/NAD(P)-binding protein [Phycicoccus sp. CSK15P-2]|uniref:FAD/NAD(P)-binding protein n=1 Tax=Phycicoccus sp. CSK15P-2 TaxID=2807627 RepID=UPI0019505BE8|nr:FAD/NAD(P)-binding protein [Phycicoccus sp. CSK15P-2]MBM6404195.1 FAD/NAD(P)-binding protein [Phycicoccus sp. CSK15P-2]
MTGLAVVGGGPRALWALERLAWWARQSGAPLPDIVVFTTARRLGASEHYDLDLPSFLRLNVASRAVDAWSVPGREGRGPSFDHWREARWPGSGDDLYPPRALAGRYLAEVGETVLAELGDAVTVRTDPVRRVTAGDRWTVTAGGGAQDFDDVLLTTGHTGGWTGALESGVPAFPPERLLSAAAAARRVVVRGAALTGIDAVLTLTEGQGGRFEADGTSLRYVPSGREPRITVVGRSGLLMVPKTDPAVVTALGVGADEIDELCSDAVARGDWPAALTTLAGLVLHRSHARFGCAELPPAQRELLEHARTMGPAAWECPPPPPALQLRHDLEVAAGRAPGDVRWALGHAWRLLHPRLVAHQADLLAVDPCSTGPVLGWPGFRAWSRSVERLAFGPPPVNGHKLLALLEAGVVDVVAGDAAAVAEQVAADAVVDAVLAPPGLVDIVDGLWRELLADGHVSTAESRRGLRVTPAGACLAGSGAPTPGLWALGRVAEDVVIGHDTLVRTLHDSPDAFARGLLGLSATDLGDVRASMVGVTPLPARLLPWQRETLRSADRLSRLLDEYGSPVNLLDAAPLAGHAAELVSAGEGLGVDVRVFFARKANKAISLAEAAFAAGHGVDVSSERELTQLLDRGADPSRVILTAAVKPLSLLRVAVDNRVCTSLDNHDELVALGAAGADGETPVAVRLAAPEPLLQSRFGFTAQEAEELLASGFRHRLEGVHFHLHGYAASDRALALDAALDVVETARRVGHRPSFIDIGGGVPMRYLDSAEPWTTFWDAHTSALLGRGPEVTWRNDPLGRQVVGDQVHGTPPVYPMWQEPVRGAWLARVLTSASRKGGTIASRLRASGVRLHVEPGRALLDGCGLTVARVAFRKRGRDGEWLIGLEMNRTQCRSAAADFLLDPVLVPVGEDRSEPGTGYLVGAYCIEAELLTLRRMSFPRGVATGDLVAFVNTAGYQMHILESASHQIPLARNLVRRKAGWELDPIDAPTRPSTYP